MWTTIPFFVTSSVIRFWTAWKITSWSTLSSFFAKHASYTTHKTTFRSFHCRIIQVYYSCKCLPVQLFHRATNKHVLKSLEIDQFEPCQNSTTLSASSFQWTSRTSDVPLHSFSTSLLVMISLHYLPYCSLISSLTMASESDPGIWPWSLWTHFYGHHKMFMSMDKCRVLYFVQLVP